MIWMTRNHEHNGSTASYDATAHNHGRTMGDVKGRLGHLYSFAKFSAYLRSKGQRVKGCRFKVVSVEAIAADTLRGLAPLPSTVQSRRQVDNFLVDLHNQGTIRLGKLGNLDVVYIDGWLAI